MPKTNLDDVEIHWEIQRLRDEIRRLNEKITLAYFILKDFCTEEQQTLIMRALKDGVGP